MRSWTQLFALGVFCCAAVSLAGAQPPAAQPGNSAADKGKAGTQPADPNAPRFDAARFVKDHDRNNDAKLSKDELPGTVQDDFTDLDANKDGAVTEAELRQHADKTARQRPHLVEVIWYTIDVPEEPITPRELQAAYDQLRKLDKNSDGKIDDSELRMMREQRKKERVEQIFSALDRNKDGKLGKDETRGQWADNFGQLDTNSDGALDRQEVEAACAARVDTQAPGQKSGQPK